MSSDNFGNTLSSLKVRLIAFWRENTEIKRAATVQAVVIFFSIPRLEWPGDGPLFETDLNKRRGPKCGHYSS